VLARPPRPRPPARSLERPGELRPAMGRLLVLNMEINDDSVVEKGGAQKTHLDNTVSRVEQFTFSQLRLIDYSLTRFKTRSEREKETSILECPGTIPRT
jgi:hypothetical protein